jgi:hypothetical protein
MSDHVGKSEANESATVPTDPQQILSSLPLRLQVLLEEHHAEKGTEQPPICASQEDAEPVTTAMGELIVFPDNFGQDATVKRFSTGFNGHIFLVAPRTSIIKHRHSGRIPREYAVWCGGDKFDVKPALQAVVDTTITLKSNISLRKDLTSSQEVFTDRVAQPSREYAPKTVFPLHWLTVRCRCGFSSYGGYAVARNFNTRRQKLA